MLLLNRKKLQVFLLDPYRRFDRIFWLNPLYRLTLLINFVWNFVNNLIFNVMCKPNKFVSNKFPFVFIIGNKMVPKFHIIIVFAFPVAVV